MPLSNSSIYIISCVLFIYLKLQYFCSISFLKLQINNTYCKKTNIIFMYNYVFKISSFSFSGIVFVFFLDTALVNPFFLPVILIKYSLIKKINILCRYLLMVINYIIKILNLNNNLITSIYI